MFHNMLGDDYDKWYAELSQKEKYIIELSCLLTLSERGREDEIIISQEVYVDKEKNKFRARYIVDAPIA